DLHSFPTRRSSDLSWFSGYTTEYSLAVWTGYPSLKNKDGDVQYIRYDGSQDIAKQLFQRLMSEISDPDTPDFEKPDSVVSKGSRSEEHTSELQSRFDLVCRLLLEKKKNKKY